MFLAVSAPMGSAAGTTTVTMSPAQTTAEVGETVAVDIIVDDAAGGVGAWEATVTLGNGDVADIVDVTQHGNPGLQTVDIAENGDSVYFDAALANTDDTGPVKIATVTVELTGTGHTSLDLAIDALGDEEGDRYTVTDISGATVSGPGDETPTDTATATATATATPTPTDDHTGAVGGDSTDAGIPTDTDSNSTDDDPTDADPDPTDTVSEGPTDTNSDQTDSAEGTTSDGATERNSPGTDTAERTESPDTPGTTNGISAPGFTGITALVAMCLAVAVLLRRP